MLDFLLKTGFGFAPMLLFLAALVHFDSFKLVRLPIVLIAIAGGALAAVVGYFANGFIAGLLDLNRETMMRFGAPAVEETLTAIVIVILIWTKRIGFAFDGAILGFAAGTGFAIIENIYYFRVLGDEHFAIWVVRGFGTAIMHGGTTAIFAMAGHVAAQRSEFPNFIHFLPGLVLAIVLHGMFNSFLNYPVSSTIVVMLALPLAMTALLQRDKKTIEDWLAVDFAAHQKTLETIRAGEFEHTEAGRFLTRLRHRFDDRTVDAMTAYLELHTELILAAESLLQAHARGERQELEPATKDKLLALRRAEDKIGKTALLAMRPHLHFSKHELWEIYMLEKEYGVTHAHAH